MLSGDISEREEPTVLTDQVVVKLEALILGGRYPSGAKLREQALAEELGVSRGPLREAIRTLEGRRLLERTPRSGVQVTRLSEHDLQQILMTREALEGMTARQAAENMTVSEVNALRHVVATREAHPENTTGALFSYANDFHRLIAKGSRNRWLANCLEKDIYSVLRLYRLQVAKRCDVSDSMAEHFVIIDRIYSRDADGAEAAMREHLRRARERILELSRTRS